MSNPDAVALPWGASPSALLEWWTLFCENLKGEGGIVSVSPILQSGHTACIANGDFFKSLPKSLTRAEIASLERDRLEGAILYYVDTGASALALAAAAQPPKERVNPARMPSVHGFMVFALPLGYCESESKPGRSPTLSPVVAISWGRWPPSRQDLPSGVASASAARHAGSAYKTPSIWLTFYCLSHRYIQPPLVACSHVLFEVGSRFIRPSPLSGPAAWTQAAYTIWQIICQRGDFQLVEMKYSPGDGEARRRKTQKDATKPEGVRVIQVCPENYPRRCPQRGETASPMDWHTLPSGWVKNVRRVSHCMNPKGHGEGVCQHVEQIVIPFAEAL
ncbi:hypothetical protein ABIE67_009739 [Streptomyces sp. V4I8]